MNKDEKGKKGSFNPSEMDKERLMDKIRESVKKNITSLEGKIERSQIEGLITSLRQQLNKEKETLGALSNFQKVPTKDIVGLWSFVRVVETEEEMWFLITTNGGKEIQINGHAIYLLSPISPIGRALINHRAGEIIEVKTPGGIRKLKIKEVK